MFKAFEALAAIGTIIGIMRALPVQYRKFQTFRWKVLHKHMDALKALILENRILADRALALETRRFGLVRVTLIIHSVILGIYLIWSLVVSPFFRTPARAEGGVDKSTFERVFAMFGSYFDKKTT